MKIKIGNNEYDEVGKFIDGIAWASSKGKEFHIDKKGNPIYEERYDAVGDFFIDDISFVCLDGKSWHIDKNGKQLYHERYDSVENFSEGIAWVLLDWEEFKINKKGERIGEIK